MHVKKFVETSYSNRQKAHHILYQLLLGAIQIYYYYYYHYYYSSSMFTVLLYPAQLVWLWNGPQKTAGELEDQREHGKIH